MEWISFIGAVGLGAIIVKLIDTYISQRKTQESEYVRWIRDNKLVAFSSLAEDLLSLGLKSDSNWQPFKAHASSAKTMLLLEDQNLVRRVDQMIVDTDRLHDLSSKEDSESQLTSEVLYIQLTKEVRTLVRDLHKNLINTK